MTIKPKDIALIALFAALTAVGALISIPIPISPVPITFQVLFVLLAGLILGKYRALLSQAAYIGLGVIGLPVFSKGASGLGTLFGPTGGYLIGFLIAAFVIGWISEIKIKWPVVINLVACVAGIIIIYALGSIQLMYVMKFSVNKTLLTGVVPFVPGELAKVVLALFVAMALEKTGMNVRQEIADSR